MVDEPPASIIGAPLVSAPGRGAAVAFIFVTILLDMFALGLIMPILPKLVESFVDNATASAARIFGLFGTAWALMQFLFSPILGGLSDRFGRRPVVLLSNFGLALDYVLMALAPSLIWLFVGRVISGITSASVSTAFAYIAYMTPPERRAAVFGKIGVAFGAGFIMGPAIGGLLGGIDPRLPFWAAAGLSFANTLYGLLILPESLPHDRRSPFRWKSANPLGALHLLRSDRVLAGLSVVNFFAQLAHVVLPSTFVLYATYRYGWDATTVGLTLAMVGICAMAVQGAAIGPIVRRFGERRALLFGLCCGAAGILITGYTSTPGLSAGSTYLLPTIAAVVRGGTSLAGGTGSVVATAVGAVFLWQLQQVVTANGAAESIEFIIQGTIIALGMLLRNVPWRRVWSRLAARSPPPVVQSAAIAGPTTEPDP